MPGSNWATPGPIRILLSSAKLPVINSQEAYTETEAIAEVLGGRKVLGKTIKNPDDLVRLVRRGLPCGLGHGTC